MKSYWFCKYLLLHLMTLVTSEKYYSIIAPGSLKSNHKYTVVVTLYDADEPCAIGISILGASFNASERVDLKPFETKLIEFFPPKLLHGEYKLIAEGLKGINFKNESELNFKSDAGPKIYIQTDKAIYKPQDLVQFRVVILDEHTRPVHIREPIRIEILDHHSNRVKQYKDIELIKGVYTGKFQLSEQPVLGKWEIKVIISGKYAFEETNTIKVEKYVLPKFSVFVETAKNVLLQDGAIKAIIYGKYTFGKYVKGNATVELWDESYGEIMLQEKKLEVESSAAVVFDMKNYTALQFKYTKYLKIVAKLTEQHTGVTQTFDVVVKFQKQRYSILIPGDDIEVRHNKPFRLKAHVKHWTGAAVFDLTTPVTMLHGNKMYESTLDRNGVASFEFEYQPETNFELKYKDSKEMLPEIFFDGDIYNPDDYCKLKILGERPRLGKIVEIEVSSITDIPYLVYTIVGHASIIRMEHIKLPPSKKKYIIQITPSIEMVPNSYIYVHYIQNGNLRYEELKINFPNELENQISVIAPKQIRPGEEVSIELKAQPNSYVSILAVDLGVYLLDSSYDIYKSKIIEDLVNDKSYTPFTASVYPGLISGLITITNAHFLFKESYSTKVAYPIPEDIRFRKNFPETWIFQNIAVNNKSTKLTLNIPDTVTTWRITAFSNNEVTGFGVVDGPTDITTIKPFFMTLNLPYSIKRGEQLKLPITVFNYHNKPIDTEVIFYNVEEEFLFVDSSKIDCQKQMIKQINVPSEGGATVVFLIKPKKLGEINLRVSATGSNYSDAIHQKLIVEPDGVTKHHSHAEYLSVVPGATLDFSYKMDIPTDIVPESEYITVSVGGNFLVPSIDNLNDLVQIPTGCGEQNMVNFAPNVLIIEYLKATGQYYKHKDLVRSAKNYIEIGFQQQLSFRHKNGGYSVFGENSDSDASSWLTAYVVRFFIKASKYYSIESSIIESSMDFLVKQQFDYGEFGFTGYLFNPTHQSKYGFTAFVLLTFLEDSKYSKIYQNTIQTGLEYINSHLDDVEDIYSLAIIATALSMAKDNNFHKVIDKIKLLSNEDNGLMWWTANDMNSANDIEITSYVLMALLDTVGDHRSILTWLIEQQNSQGGFKSTHDTVVGLEALIKYSEKVKYQNNTDLNVTYSALELNGKEVQKGHFEVELENMLILQKHKLPSSTRHISLNLNGTGHSLVQLSHQYNVVQEESVKHFLIKPKPNQRNAYELDLEICFTYLSILDINNITNMVILEANLPSGYRSEAESSEDLLKHELILRIESKNDESTIIVYFDYLKGHVEYCINIAADNVNEVAMRKPVAIVLYDYYNLNRTNTVFYTVN